MWLMFHHRLRAMKDTFEDTNLTNRRLRARKMNTITPTYLTTNYEDSYACSARSHQFIVLVWMCECVCIHFHMAKAPLASNSWFLLILVCQEDENATNYCTAKGGWFLY